MKKRLLRICTLGILLILILSGVIYGKLNEKMILAAGTKAELPESTVSIVQSDKAKNTDLTLDDIRRLASESISKAGGLESVVHNGDTVILKPNLVAMSTGSGVLAVEGNGVTTDWRVVKAVAEIVRRINPNGKILVMEGTGANATTPMVFEHFNYNKSHIPEVDRFVALEDESGGWREYTSDKLIKLSLPNALLFDTYYMNKEYYNADVLISIPCLKTHTTVITGAIKNTSIGATPPNIYGKSPTELIRQYVIPHDMVSLHKFIRDYYVLRPVDFVVMDDLVGLGGAFSQNKYNMRSIIAGKDAIAVDTVLSLVSGWDPESVPHLKYLAEDGMGNIDVSKITIAGEQIDEVRKDLISYVTEYGRKITDKTPPLITVNSSSISSNTLSLSLNANSDTKKVEIILDGKKVPGAITSNFNNIKIENLDTYKSSGYSIVINAYDKYFNRTQVQVTETPTPQSSTNIQVYVNGTKNTFSGEVKDGTVLLPLSFYTKKMSAKTSWNSKKGVATIQIGKTKMIFTKGSKKYSVGSKSKTMSTTLMVKGSTVLVPVKYVAAETGWIYNYDKVKKILKLSKKK